MVDGAQYLGMRTEQGTMSGAEYSNRGFAYIVDQPDNKFLA